MKKKVYGIIAVSLICFTSCAQNNSKNKGLKVPSPKTEDHKYGGWYCPDNLRGFPPVDYNNWENVSVINGRMPQKEETQNGTSLIFVDTIKYPDAKVLDMRMPKLALFYNEHSKRKDFVIVIQAFSIGKDSIVGFRYLNGGNGSANINEIKFLDKEDIDNDLRFVTQKIKINAISDSVWKIITDTSFSAKLQFIFDKQNQLNEGWRKKSNVNYNYVKARKLGSAYADKLFGNFYIQNDCLDLNYTEKFLLVENREAKTTELTIVSGPFNREDFEEQKEILIKWSEKVKELSETTSLNFIKY